AEPEPVAPPSRERQVATAPSPDEIRARAEKVREAARAARAGQQQPPRQAPAFDDDTAPGLFDLDDLSIEAGSLDDEPLPQRRYEEQEPAAAKPQPQPAQPGRFAIHRLISRVAGSSDAHPATMREEPRAEAFDEDEGEIPAFLRRQAN
ncbi:MAG: hypothetical protein AAF074_16015, partial [Pseudomonadota bacterium]